MSIPESILQGLRDYFYACPLLAGGRIRLEYLGARPMDFSLESVPAEPVVKQYVSGDSLRQLVFVLASREGYGPEDQQAIASSGLYEGIGEWVEEQNQMGVLPVLPADRLPQAVELTTSGYVFTEDIDTARYQIQGRVIYYRRGC